MDKKLSIRFLDIYNQLDNYLRKRLERDDDVSHSFLIKKAAEKDLVIRSQKENLLQFSQLRNAIVHNPDRAIAHPIAEPHSIIVDQYEDVLSKILNPVKALSISVPAEKIYKTSLNDIAINIMRVMNDKVFTHVPVIEDDKMVGVFSENVVFSYLVKHEIVSVDRDIKISEFREFLPHDKHQSEYFLFAMRTASLIEIQKLFDNELGNNRRLGVVFITHNGKADEKLLGMITAWDVVGK